MEGGVVHVGNLVFVEVELLELLLVEEGFGGDVDQMVVAEVDVLEVPVELECSVDGFDFVVSQDEPLDGRVEGDGEDVQFAFFAVDVVGFVVADAACGTAHAEG